MSWLATAIGVWVAGFVLTQLLFSALLADEPTAHGQIIGRQWGCIIGFFWPLALPYFAIVLIVVGVVKLWRRVSGR